MTEELIVRIERNNVQLLFNNDVLSEGKQVETKIDVYVRKSRLGRT